MNLKDINYDKIKKALPIILILIAISFSTYYRMQPSSLPITDTWAKYTLDSSIQNQISNTLRSQYPDLPDAAFDTLLIQNTKDFIDKNKQEYNNQIKLLSKSFKDEMRDDNGDTYLLAIDPYYWYTQTKNIINLGHAWDKIIDGREVLSVRQGRFGREPTFNLHPYIQAYLYKFLHFFNRDISIMKACFLMPVILIGLSLIPAFYIGKKIAGNFAGFFAAMIIAINASLLGRTPAGFSDTDSYSILLPLFAVWFYLLSLNKKKYSWAYAMLSGIVVIAYNLIWPGASYILIMILGCAALYIIYSFLTKKELKHQIISFVTYTITSFVGILLTKGTNYFIHSFVRPITFLRIKDVAVASLWPNVMTTVAEFGESAFVTIINHMGGKLLFLLAVIGLILLAIKERKHFKYSIFIIPWFLATLVPYIRGQRFSIMLVPAFAIATGISIGLIYKYISSFGKDQLHIPDYLIKPVLAISLCLLLLPQLSEAQKVVLSEIPSMNDSWYNALIEIKEDSPGGQAIITSWWDFGHWFYAISERSTTFDGASQGRSIHWIGKTLLTNNEDEAMLILRQQNCGQNYAYMKLFDLYKDDYTATNRLNYLVYGGMPTEEEKEIYDQYINCQDLWPEYFIVSQDMIGKSGVWAHFGSWDFDRAKMYQSVKKLNSLEGIALLKEEFNLSDNEANNIYYEIQNNDADKWVSGWPSISTSYKCYEDNESIYCDSITINKTSMDVTFPGGKPDSISYLENDTFKVKYFNESTTGISLILYYYSNYYLVPCDPLLVDSMFTRLYFFNGIGLDHFKLLDHKVSFTGEDIFVYKVNFDNISQTYESSNINPGEG